MIDCGEGSQKQMRVYKTGMNKLHSIFISHLHGDHVLGLPGLISSLNLLGRTGDLNLYAHEEISHFLMPTLESLCPHLSFRVNIIPLQQNGRNLLYENNSMRIFSFPLKHRIPTCGFLFEEKENPLRIKREMIDFYQISIRDIKRIKAGEDFLTSDGTVVKNKVLTYPSAPPRRYAYCSDTMYSPDIVGHVMGVDLLYHEATFLDEDASRARLTFHSTAKEAALIAKQAQVKKLLLGHYSSRYLQKEAFVQEAKTVFANTDASVEGMIIEL